MTAVVNATENNGIGRDGALLFSVSEDLKRFRRLTTGHPIIYGRNTLATFPKGQPLKNRENLLLSRTLSEVPGAEVFSDVPSLLRHLTEHGGWGRAMVVGGARVYGDLLPYCDRVELTRTLTECPADAFFPDLAALPEWTLAEMGPVLRDEADSSLTFRYETWVRTRPAVIFDLDGTLWNSTEQILPAWNAVAREQGREISLPELVSWMGKTVEEIGALAFPALPAEQSTALVDRCSREELFWLRKQPGVLYPGVRALLRALSERFRLMIVSNSQDGYIQTFLDTCDLWSYISDIEMYGRTRQSKGQNIRAVLERNDIQNAVFVGDTPGDRDAAREAGIPFVWAAYGFGVCPEEPLRLRTPGDLPDLLTELWSADPRS